jgi:Zn finger protein HypA/HybF involved in hydrogenase expression
MTLDVAIWTTWAEKAEIRGWQLERQEAQMTCNDCGIVEQRDQDSS